MDQKEILSTQQLAAECGLTEGRIRQLIGASRIKTTMFGGTHAITRLEAELFKASRLAAHALDPRIKIAVQTAEKAQKAVDSVQKAQRTAGDGEAAPFRRTPSDASKSSGRGKQDLAGVWTGGSMSAEKVKSASEGNRDARCDEATLTTVPSTAVLFCDVYGTIRSTPPTAPEDLIAKDQPEDCFTVRQHSRHWRDTQQHAGGLRWQTNGRRDAR
jgi:hypothetical protein